jgi:hypothetical protein
MNVFALPVADGYELEFISEDNNVTPEILLSSLADQNQDVYRLVAEIKNFSGKLSVRKISTQTGTRANSVAEQNQLEDVSKVPSINEIRSQEDLSEGDASQLGRFDHGTPLSRQPEQTRLSETKRSESFDLPPRIDNIVESKLSHAHSSSGSMVSVKSKSNFAKRTSSPSTSSPSINNLKSYNPWDLQSPLKSLKKPTMQKSQSKGLSGLFLRKSIIPQHIREARVLMRSYFYPANDSNESWCNESGKIVPSPAIMKVISHLSSRDLSDKSPNNNASEPDIVKMLGPPTKLHALCAASSINYEDVELELDERPDDAAVLDSRHRTPLHVLADNDALFLDPQGRFTVIAVIARLIQIHPEAMTSMDSMKRMPFVPLIEDWCTWVYDSEEQDRLRRRADVTTFFSLSEEHGAEQQQGNSRRMSVNHVTRAAAQVTAGATRTALAGAKTMMKYVDEKFIRVDSLFHEPNDGVSRGSAPKAGRLYPQVKVSDEFDCSLRSKA